MRKTSLTILTSIILSAFLLTACSDIDKNRGFPVRGQTAQRRAKQNSSPVDYEVTTITETPNMSDSAGSDYDTGERYRFDNLAPATIDQDEMVRQTKEILDGLLLLEPSAIERLIPFDFYGSYFRPRHMLEAASNSKVAKKVFQNLASLSSYEVIAVGEGLDGLHQIYIKCSTPYVADYALQ